MAARRKKKEPEKPPECINIWPYFVLKLYGDGTAGFMSVKASAYWERAEHNVKQYEARLRRELDLIERWKRAPRREKIELWT